MARKLGEILVAGRLVSPADLKKALDAQLARGGRLGTNLVEMGLLDESALAEALREQKHVAVASQAMLEAASPEALALLPAALAERHEVVPLSVKDGVLEVAMLDPLDAVALDELAFATGCRISGLLAPELRLRGFLEKYYAIAQPDRASSAGVAAPPGPSREPLRVSSLAEAAARLAAAESRDDVGETLVALARSSFARSIAWIVQKDRALGWLGSVEGLPPETARGMARAASVSLAEPSVLAEVVASRRYYMGELPRRGEDERVGDAFGTPWPRNVLLLPIEMGGQVVLVLQCDDAERSFASFDLRALRSACEKATLAMEVLLLRARIRQA